MSEERRYAVRKSAYLIILMAEIIKIENRAWIYDTDLKPKSLGKFSQQIMDGAHKIRMGIRKTHEPMDEESFVIDHALQFHRMMSHFAEHGCDKVKEFMDLVDISKMKMEMTKVDKPTKSDPDNQLSLL